MGRRRRYFTDADFDAFAIAFAESDDQTIIRARKRVVEEKFRPLHEGFGGAVGLGDFMAERGLYPHWRKANLTNVYWPWPQANNGWVDHLRMGYGKEEHLVRELVRRAQIYTELTRLGTYDQVAFHYVTQLQLGLSENGWWVNLYMDDKAWLEQRNLLSKIESPAHRRQWLEYLEALMKSRYNLWLIPAEDEDAYEAKSPEEFTEELQAFHRDRTAVSVSIELYLPRNAPENNKDTILDFLKTEFDRLLPLYRFVAWHPVHNNYLNL